jgi:hypothetical protein
MIFPFGCADQVYPSGKGLPTNGKPHWFHYVFVKFQSSLGDIKKDFRGDVDMRCAVGQGQLQIEQDAYANVLLLFRQA